MPDRLLMCTSGRHEKMGGGEEGAIVVNQNFSCLV